MASRIRSFEAFTAVTARAGAAITASSRRRETTWSSITAAGAGAGAACGAGATAATAAGAEGCGARSGLRGGRLGGALLGGLPCGSLRRGRGERRGLLLGGLAEDADDDGVAARCDLVPARPLEGDDHAADGAPLVLVLRGRDGEHPRLADLDRRLDAGDVGAGEVHDEPRRVVQLEDRVGGGARPLDRELDRAVALRDVDRPDQVRLRRARPCQDREGAPEDDTGEGLRVRLHGYSSRFSAASLGRRSTVWVLSRVPSARRAHSETTTSPERTAATTPPFFPTQAPRRTE